MVKRRKDKKNRVLKEGEYQRKNGTFEFRWRDKQGKRHYIYAKSLAELREKKKAVLKNVFDGINTKNKNMTINDLYYLWRELKRGLKDNTFQNYQYMYEQFVEPDFGRIKITDLKRSDVRAYYNRLHDEDKLKVSTIDSIHTVLHQVIELAVEDDYIRYNPSDNALRELKKANNHERVKKKALTIEEQKLFLDFLKSSNKYSRWYPIFTVMIWTGLRVGELTGLRWCDIDLDKQIIEVNHTLVYYSQGKKKGCTYAINTPKTKAGIRTIPMLPIVKQAFIQEKEIQKELELKCKARIDGYTDFIFLNRFGETLNYGVLNKVIKRIIRDCNYEILDKRKSNQEVTLLPKFSNHSLRHTFTTRICEAGMNIKAMQSILGHSDIETTMNIYAEASDSLNRSEINKFQDYFSECGVI